MSAGKRNSADAGKGAAETTIEISESSRVRPTKLLEARGKRRRVGALAWKAGEARGWRSTFLSL